jgi:hypothetical protein
VLTLVSTERSEFLYSWNQNCKHVTQMMRSGFGLNSEELLALLTSLSELEFAKTCLHSLGMTDLPLMEIPSVSELKQFLTSQADVYPASWSLPDTVVLDSKNHWWWSNPGTTFQD